MLSRIIPQTAFLARKTAIASVPRQARTLATKSLLPALETRRPAFAPRNVPSRKFATETSSDGPFAVVSLMGKDRKGIVRDFSSMLAKLGANVEESRMSRLGGTFAIIMLVSLKGNQFSEFQKQISAAFPDFQIHSTLTESQKAVLEDPSTAPYEIAVDGPDSVGIVSAITAAISKIGNITHVETEVGDAPFAGFKMFSMIARADLTVEKVPELETELAKIENDFGLEIDCYTQEVSEEED